MLEQTPASSRAPTERATASADSLGAAEARTRTTIDQAIRRYTTTRQWPALTDEQWSFVELRLNYALGVLTALTQGVAGRQPPPGLSSGAAVQWLLIDGWALGGATCMRRQMALFARWLPPSEPVASPTPDRN